jgi:hypothetical protein
MRAHVQVRTLTARAEELQRKLEESGESNRIITQAVRMKQTELDQLAIRHAATTNTTSSGTASKADTGELRWQFCSSCLCYLLQLVRQ